MREDDSLVSVLRKRPTPSRVTYKVEGSKEEHALAIPKANKDKWKTVAGMLEAKKAVAVFCYDADGDLMRTWPLPEGEDEDDEPGATAGVGGASALRIEERIDARMSAAHAAQAAMFDAYGMRINEAHRAGAEAASQSQEHLVQLVQTLTEAYAQTIISLHTVTVNFVKTMQDMAGAEGADQHTQNQEQLMTLAAKVLPAILANGTAGPAAQAPGGKKP